MSFRTGSSLLAVLLSGVLSATFAAGCGGGGNGDDDPIDPERHPRLEFVSSSSVFLLHSESTDLRVRYIYDDGAPIGSSPLAFTTSGDTGGAFLDASSAITAADGTAGVRLTSGGNDATFRVQVTPPEGMPLEFAISVSETEVGAIVVRMTYDGEEDFTTYRPYLFLSHRCTALNPESLPLPAERAAATVSSISERPRFDNVLPGGDYTVVILGEVSGVIEGWGCADRVQVSGSNETTVDIAIEDIGRPLIFEGVYDIDSYLDFADTLPPSVSTGIQIFDELTDDQDVECNLETEDYGQDPGAFLLDFVMRWTCHWECLPSEDYDTCSEINHATGDLEALCTENFQDWSGVEPNFFGGCGTWELIGETAQDFINDQILGFVPGFVTDILNMAGDLARAINHAHIYSLLTIDEAGELGSPFTHVLTEMQVRLRDWAGDFHEFRFDLDEVGLDSLTASETALVTGETLNLAEHRFELDYGELVRYIYVHGLLQTILGYDDTADMLATWINCGDVADWLVDHAGILTRDTYLDACDRGIEAAGGAIESGLARAISASGHLTLAGTVAAGDVADDMRVETLVDGEWDGSWGEGTEAGPVTGDFTGERR